MLEALEAKGAAPDAALPASRADARRARSRTLAVGALAALGGFALTAVLVASRPRRNALPAPASSAPAAAAPAAVAEPVVTPVLAAPLDSAGPPGRVTATALVPAAAPAVSAAPPNKPKKSAPERQHREAGSPPRETGVASSLHLSTREP
jgi:hypothetical protein